MISPCLVDVLPSSSNQGTALGMGKAAPDGHPLGIERPSAGNIIMGICGYSNISFVSCIYILYIYVIYIYMLY